VKLYVEDGYPADLVAEELGVGHQYAQRLGEAISEQGEVAFQSRDDRPGRPQVSAARKKKAVELKKQNPGFGTKRISHLLRRMFFLKAGPETVRQTLRKQKLIERPAPKPKRNPAKPRFFERTTPNQMWQADIFSFAWAGRAPT